MDNICMTDRVSKKLEKLYGADNETIHFLWDCAAGVTDTLGGSVVIPQNTDNPFIYLQREGFVDPQFDSFYSVYCARIDDAVWVGDTDNALCADIRMRFSPDGEYKFCHLYSNLLKADNGKVTDIHVQIRPFSAKEEFNREVLSYFTSDKNPAIFTKKATEKMQQGEDGRVAFIQFDVERFKLINDTYGSKVGDDVLQFITDTLNILCGERQPHCRLTADVFMIVTDFEERDELFGFIRMLESRLSYYKGLEYRLIFGVSIVTDKTKSSRSYGDSAAMARQSIKGKAMENIAFFDETMMSSLHKTQAVEEDMHKAVVNGEFVMYLQPKYCISTGKIVGAEALARWIHPERGMVSPAEFIPVFERNGFIIKLDRIIWEAACRRIKQWIDSGRTPVPISVNVSREYLASFDIVQIISNLVNKYNIPKELLELEITETVENDNVREIVKQFKDRGFTMLMDDFGSGYSSLNMLKSTQFDVLKIDREFFSEFMETDRGRKIITHTISMSQDIGLDIIAEGVETNEQASFLAKCGCDTAQGFLYSRPIPADEFDKLLFAQDENKYNYIRRALQ